MEGTTDSESKPPTFLTEIRSSESPIIDPKQHICWQPTLSEKTIESENGDFRNSENSSEPPAAFSKRQLKRLKKIQNRLKMQAKWKLQRKLKNKARRARHKLEALILEKPKITPMSNSSRKFTAAIDFSYDELMSPKDLIKCGSQVIRCYSANRRSSNPMQLHFCNFSGKIEAELAKNNGYRKWDIHFHEESYLDIFNKSDLVYLTSESRNVLDTLEENKVYIIGGLVDHNAHKGISYQKAVREGIAHAQLPIKKYIQMKSRSVLTINHVFEILLKVSNGETWQEALMTAVPSRFFVSQAAIDELSKQTATLEKSNSVDVEMPCVKETGSSDEKPTDLTEGDNTTVIFD